MRLFTAIELPDAIRERLIEAQQLLRERIQGKVSWVAGEKLHLTLKFLGEVAASELPRLCEALGEVKSPGFSLAASQIATLPPRGNARVISSEVEGDLNVLDKLFESIEAVCEQFGIVCEKRKYHPHITLARLRVPRHIEREIEELRFKPANRFCVEQFVLMQSRLSSKGSEYQCVASFELKAGQP
jgi:2'-5' RNA ligase